jgi:gamma-glutamyltranspeptidase/glutathione hydrolase
MITCKLPLKLLASIGFLVACSVPASDAGRDAQGSEAAVTSGHRLASEVGLAVLRNGGNAMDAAITMAAVLAVTRPHANGLGGDMFLLYYESATGRVHGLNSSGWSGTRAGISEVRAVLGDVDAMPPDGPLTVTVPGAVRGWGMALERFGSITWREALNPAVQIAVDGLPVSERLAADIAAQEQKLARDAEAARIYLPGGMPPSAGAILEQEDLASTLEMLSERGPDGLYTGEMGERIARAVTEGGGFLDPQDLSEYQPQWVDPIRTGYLGFEAVALPPNTQGLALLEELAILRAFDLRSMGHNSADYLHTVAEAIRLAVLERDANVADPAAMRVSVADLLDSVRIAGLGATIRPSGSAPGADVAVRGGDHPNTVYASAVDANGNAVSLIQSLYQWFGSGMVVPETGIVLHNRGALFALDPAHPNALTPRKLPYHTLCPAMVLREGAPWLVFGTPGGDGQTHTLTQVLNNILLFGMTPQQAIDSPRLRRLPNGDLAVENGIPETALAELRERGYRVLVRYGWGAEFGGAQAVLIDPGAGTLRAGADRRREAYALAY